MKLTLKDFIKYEEELLTELEGLRTMLKAVRLLIGLYSEGEIPIPTTIPPFSVSETIKKHISELSWFNVMEMVDLLIADGIRGPDERERFRPVISSLLKRLYLKNKLIRRNARTDKRPVYEYKEVTEHKETI